MSSLSPVGYRGEQNGIHYIPHEKIEQFKKDPLFKNDEINEKLKPDAYGLSPIFVINPKRFILTTLLYLRKK